MCGVPYGEIDADRLINSLILVLRPRVRGRTVVGVAEKGLSALESLLFAKYQMYSNVYWHHAVRSATAMYKRLVDDACRSGALSNDQLTQFTDEALLYYLSLHAPSPLLQGLRARQLYKRAAPMARVGAGRIVCRLDRERPATHRTSGEHARGSSGARSRGGLAGLSGEDPDARSGYSRRSPRRGHRAPLSPTAALPVSSISRSCQMLCTGLPVGFASLRFTMSPRIDRRFSTSSQQHNRTKKIRKSTLALTTPSVQHSGHPIV